MRRATSSRTPSTSGCLDAQTELHEKFAHVQRMKQRLREIEAELSENHLVITRDAPRRVTVPSSFRGWRDHAAARR